jgi:hypothetical protein
MPDDIKQGRGFLCWALGSFLQRGRLAGKSGKHKQDHEKGGAYEMVHKELLWGKMQKSGIFPAF